METEESRKFLSRLPATEELVARILFHKGIDFKDEEIFNWSIRTVRMPAENTNSGQITVGKLFVDNEFVINIFPVDDKLQKIIDELYPVPKSKPNPHSEDQDVEPIPQ